MAQKPSVTLPSDAKSDRQNAIFNVLSDARRRFIFQHLRGADTPISVAELATAIAAWETEGSVGARADGDADSIEINLVHNHLPRMVDAGIVEYDTTRRTVALTDLTAEVQPHLEIIGNV